MKLTGSLKKQVEKAESKTEKKNLIKKAGMLLTDEELDKVSGGMHHEGDGDDETIVSGNGRLRV